MLLKKFNSLALCFGLLGSLACQNVSGTGKVSHKKDDYIYTEDKRVNHKESAKKSNALLSTVKKKLEKAKKFVSENPGTVASTATLGVLAPAASYAGYKVKQRYFNKGCETSMTDVQLENPVKDKMDIEIPAEPTKSGENIENVRVSNHTLPGDSNNNSTTSSEEKNSVYPSDGSIKNEKSSENNAENLDPAANNGEVLNSSGNVNVLDEDKNLNKKSVFLGVYSELIIYLLLKLTPQSWGLQKAWYDFFHYKNCHLAQPLKLILAVILWVGFCFDSISLIIALFEVYDESKEDTIGLTSSQKKHFKLLIIKDILSFVSPVASRLIGIFCKSMFMPEKKKEIEVTWKDRLAGAILGYGDFNLSVYSHNQGNILW